MVQIDTRAIVDDDARLDDGVVVEPFAIVGPGVTVGRGTTIGSSALVQRDTRIGQECRIGHCAAVGTDPQDLKYRGESTYLRIGDRTIIREFATVNRATGEGETTIVGSDVFVMAYAHVAHNCIVGNSVILANSVNLAGHVTIDDHAVLGGMVPVHQFVRIGAYSFVGGHSRVTKDVPPYVKAAGSPMKPVDINSIGLQRQGFPDEVIEQLRSAYRLLYLSGLNTTQALERIRADLPETEELKTLVEFVEASDRGIVK